MPRILCFASNGGFWELKATKLPSLRNVVEEEPSSAPPRPPPNLSLRARLLGNRGLPPSLHGNLADRLPPPPANC